MGERGGNEASCVVAPKMPEYQEANENSAETRKNAVQHFQKCHHAATCADFSA
jgi:NAD-dependent dihydropyrimidine dehydrogenase PreA subunit